MTLTGKVLEFFDTLQIRAATSGSDASEVSPSDHPIATIRRERLAFEHTFAISLFRGNCEDASTGESTSTSTGKNGNQLVAKLNKSWLIPVYRYYTVDPETGALNKRFVLCCVCHELCHHPWILVRFVWGGEGYEGVCVRDTKACVCGVRSNPTHFVLFGPGAPSV
jgi:hypothetical protein